jgi:hypothetical protein
MACRVPTEVRKLRGFSAGLRSAGEAKPFVPLGNRWTTSVSLSSASWFGGYAEPNPGYDLLAQEAFRKAQVPFDVRLVSDCEELLQYLSKCEECSSENVPCPDVILLNLRIFGQVGIAGLARPPGLP